ncbi:hypothetical protein [Planctobacterium marinum]|uniref:hypothetical protein n=1 Tax=Planctobacterium marinum TaxID=1631968 RepID=UPI001E371041|nr:hypothetical protein [Planctobacterium marinum]MCC2604788.1 hypothetical protein [Planctobacterium marinum]
MTILKTLTPIVFSVGLLTACGGGSNNETNNSGPDNSGQPPPTDYQITVLMIGNSHTSTGNLPQLLQNTLQSYAPDGNILVERAVKSMFLSEHLEDDTTMAHFDERDWDYVVLQAQKYSISRTIEYPTDAAQTFIDKTKAKGGIPILYPEWGQRNLAGEAEYIYGIHHGIAIVAPTCIAPVGFAWDNALRIQPSLSLHASDGNHANSTGAYLTSLVLFETITAHPADLLGVLNHSSVNADTQLFLQQMATQAIVDYPPCESLAD